MSSARLRAAEPIIKATIDEYTTGANRRIAGLYYTAVRGDGELLFEYASGTRGLHCPEPMSEDTVFWLASFTKLCTSIAAMQLVERGVLDLDNSQQLESIAPELRDIKVLQGNKGGGLLVPKMGSITLRMLLTHTAGFGYAFEDEKLAEYGRPVGLDDFCGEPSDLFRRPLVNHPGEKFQYGTSMDWVGILIERVTGISLELYFRENIFQPLGIESITFHPSEEHVTNLAYMHRRNKDGSLAHADHIYSEPLRAATSPSRDNVFCAGGHGCFGKPSDFAKIIAMLLNQGRDATTGREILQKYTVKEMFRDQLVDKPRYSSESVPVAKPWLANPTPLFPVASDHTEGWGLSFSISHFPHSTGRAAGSASWEGLANLFWFADPVNNVGGIIASQILPYGDASVIECSDRVEKMVYSSLGIS
ncbi:hypothetical protein PFICI_09754 [Pestalotiopsis fici W106-1]|uniref:Beta-lactamase-related domain-containing protein n=1 Tax=Pestalotiopsis fici (strain W106-1 / CGMCC3.15140) TaxID=1229662 RepID=W3WX49_PESFW|nr:uncharacterized protein PFICI_09754 [Pestalotiopsis fici W106-1]ETS77692.1 hypothetical protein PFICI_09754 [Pestalotiopsis fici W106-1]